MKHTHPRGTSVDRTNISEFPVREWILFAAFALFGGWSIYQAYGDPRYDDVLALIFVLGVFNVLIFLAIGIVTGFKKSEKIRFTVISTGIAALLCALGFGIYCFAGAVASAPPWAIALFLLFRMTSK